MSQPIRSQRLGPLAQIALVALMLAAAIAFEVATAILKENEKLR